MSVSTIVSSGRQSTRAHLLVSNLNNAEWVLKTNVRGKSSVLVRSRVLGVTTTSIGLRRLTSLLFGNRAERRINSSLADRRVEVLMQWNFDDYNEHDIINRAGSLSSIGSGDFLVAG